MVNQTFENYFGSTEDYPENLAIYPLRKNILYNYVSSSYLDGFINYVKPIKAFVLNRCVDWNDNIYAELDILYRGKEKIQLTENNTKLEVYEELIKPDVTNDELWVFNDDVVILANALDKITGKIFYFFFWFDIDTSDCSIAKIETDDPEEIVINKFVDHILDISERFISKDIKEIPVAFFEHKRLSS